MNTKEEQTQGDAKEEFDGLQALENIYKKFVPDSPVGNAVNLIKEQAAELQSLRDQLATKEDLLDNYRKDHANLTQHLMTWDKSLKETKSELQQRDETIKEQEKEITHWKGGYNAANDTIKELKEALKDILEVAEGDFWTDRLNRNTLDKARRLTEESNNPE